jgi:hypothetical protein
MKLVNYLSQIITSKKHKIRMAMKLHMRGAQNIYYFGLLEYVAIIDILLQRRR